MIASTRRYPLFLHMCLLCFLTAASAAGAWVALSPDQASADIGPRAGNKRVRVEHALQKIEGFETYSFFLVSTNGRESWQLDVVPVSREGGDLDIPSGYMDRTVLVALTEAQLTELAKLALTLKHFEAERPTLSALDDKALAAAFASQSWSTTLFDMEAFKQKARTEVPLMAFFMRDDVAVSHTLGFRTDIPSSVEGDTFKKTWKVVSIEGGEFKLELVEEKAFDKDGNLILAPRDGGGVDGPLGLWLGVGMVLAGVLLAVVIQMRRQTQEKRQTVAQH